MIKNCVKCVFTTNLQTKRYFPFTSTNPRHCLTNIPFSLGKRICTTVENENVTEKRLKKTEKTTMQEQKYPMSLVKAIILRTRKYLLKF